jgi:ribonucleoside-diphosphate reductase alpha chain
MIRKWTNWVSKEACMPDLSRRRNCHATAVTIGGERFRVTASERDDGTLGDVLIRWGKHGSSRAGLMDGYATALAVGLQHRVPLATLLKPGLGVYCTPNGHTDDPEIPRVRSVIDYLSRRLAIDWLPYPERASLGIFTHAEQAQQAVARTWTRDLAKQVGGYLGQETNPVPRPLAIGPESAR